jgi:hypothetical protein
MGGFMKPTGVRGILEHHRYGINPCGYPIGGEAFNNLEKSFTDQAESDILALIPSVEEITEIIMNQRYFVEGKGWVRVARLNETSIKLSQAIHAEIMRRMKGEVPSER